MGKSFRELRIYKRLHPYWKHLKNAYRLVISRHTDYFDIHKLSNIRYDFVGPHGATKEGNICFGNKRVIKRYLGKSYRDDCNIEHGHYGMGVIEYEMEEKCVNVIYTFSDFRKEIINNHYNWNLGKEIIPIGPYIRFAPNFKSKRQLSKLKKKLGKILLVFPCHGYPSFHLEYDENAFIESVKEVAADYDTVLVSLNGHDIANKRDEFYSRLGFIPVSSGNRTEQFFLYRQRDLIELSDMTMSNSLGTHVGYCIALGKPHYIFKQDIILNRSDSKGILNKEWGEHHDIIRNAFSSKEPRITREQYDIVHKYWGAFDELTSTE